MSIALSAVPGVLSPLQGWWRWLMSTTEPDKPAGSNCMKAGDEVAINFIATNHRHTCTESQNTSKVSVSRPLRIVRVLEANHSPAHVGRMVISGCMADVCAELDRLAAYEAACH